MLRQIWKPSTLRGFLPVCNPSEQYKHHKFQGLSKILDEMPVHLGNGKKGILSVPGDIVDIARCELSGDKEITEHDIISLLPHETYGLFRDLTFLASGYLLEPTYHHYISSGGKAYGPGRDVLPEYISRPLHIVSNRIGSRPFMEYNQSYALYNWKIHDRHKRPYYDNISLIRRLEGGTSEDGFIRVHIDMVAESYRLVSGVNTILESSQDNESLKSGLQEIVVGMTKILDKFQNMWYRSKPSDYGAFRAFIFGTKNQSAIFPNGGVRYLGIGADNTYIPCRGESGANDSMIPLLDNLVQLQHHENELTLALQDFRTYRPYEHIAYLEWVAKKSNDVGLRKIMSQSSDDEVRRLYHTVLTHIASFRKLHWELTKKYIIAQTEYPTATGGTPITKWLPNQLISVFKQILTDFPNDSLTIEKYKRLQCDIYSVQQKIGIKPRSLDELLDF